MRHSASMSWLWSCLPVLKYQVQYMVLSSISHWDRVTHICVSKLTIIGSDDGLSPGRSKAIIWTNDGMLLIGPPGTHFSEILIEINTFFFIQKIAFENIETFDDLYTIRCTYTLKIKHITTRHSFSCDITILGSRHRISIIFEKHPLC